MMQLDVVRAADAACRKGAPGALATIVAVRGSAYQREGTSIFIGADGAVCGLISGGCLESEVAAVAKELPPGGVRVLRYDTSDESVFGYGMGCPGVIDVLLEDLRGPAEPRARFLSALAKGEAAARAVRVDRAREGELKEMVLLAGQRLGDLGAAEVEAAFADAAAERLDHAAAGEAVRLAAGGEAIFAWAAPVQAECVIFGATDDAQPLGRLAVEIGLRVRVVDPRGHLATRKRFPGAEVRCLPLAAYGPDLGLGPASYVVVMGHQVERDLQALRVSLEAGVPYIGLLSSRGRRDSMLGHLREAGLVADLAPRRLHAPAGLDIGARTPAEIALSIVAEICRVRRKA